MTAINLIFRNYLFVLLSWLFLSSFILTLRGDSDLVDFWARTHLNESLIHQYYFFWTSSNFLGFFFWLHFNFLLLRLLPTLVWVILALFTLYLSELVDFLQLSSSEAFYYVNYTDVNNLLSNNLNKYHPYLFFITATILLTLPTKLFKINHAHPLLFRYNWLHKNTHTWLYHLRWLSSITLFLGSWWALQEGTWGGWWNWDPSEVLGLVLLIIPLLLQHTTQSTFNLKVVLTKITTGVLIFIWMYFFTQLNFDLVSHNFGNRFNFFFLNTLFFIDSLIIISFLVLAFLINFYWRKCYKLSLLELNSLPKHLYFYQAILSFTYLLPVILSFFPLVTYFLWQTFQVNSNNVSWDSDGFIYLIIFILFFFFYHSTSTQFNQTIWLQWIYTPFILVGGLLQSDSNTFRIYSIHYTLWGLLVFNLWVNNLGIAETLFINDLINWSSNTCFYNDSFNLLTLEDFWRETVQSFALNNKQILVGYNFNNTNSSNEVINFLLTSNNNSFSNIYFSEKEPWNLIRFLDNNYFNNFIDILLLFLINTSWLKPYRV